MERVVAMASGAFLVFMAMVAAHLVRNPPATGWTDEISVNHATDETIFDFQLVSLDGDSVLSLTCRPNERIRAILFSDALQAPAGASRDRLARMRLDDSMSERPVSVRDDGIALTDPDDPASEDFITRFATSREFEIALAGAQGVAAQTIAFPTVGADDVVNRLRSSCI